MEKKTVYITNDGKEFDDLKDARMHEHPEFNAEVQSIKDMLVNRYMPYRNVDDLNCAYALTIGLAKSIMSQSVLMQYDKFMLNVIKDRYNNAEEVRRAELLFFTETVNFGDEYGAIDDVFSYLRTAYKTINNLPNDKKTPSEEELKTDSTAKLRFCLDNIADTNRYIRITLVCMIGFYVFSIIGIAYIALTR